MTMAAASTRFNKNGYEMHGKAEVTELNKLIEIKKLVVKRLERDLEAARTEVAELESDKERVREYWRSRRG